MGEVSSVFTSKKNIKSWKLGKVNGDVLSIISFTVEEMPGIPRRQNHLPVLIRSNRDTVGR